MEFQNVKPELFVPVTVQHQGTGGSFVSALTVNKLIRNGLVGWVEFDVTKDVKAFLAGKTNNFGWIIKETQEGKSGHVFFASDEATSNQPVLELRYS